MNIRILERRDNMTGHPYWTAELDDAVLRALIVAALQEWFTGLPAMPSNVGRADATREAARSNSVTRRLAHQAPGDLADENIRLRAQLAALAAPPLPDDALDAAPRPEQRAGGASGRPPGEEP